MISILMPAYNAEKYIDESINSILAQSYTDFELLICDDGSTDNTLGKIKAIEDERVIVLSNKENIGNLLTTNKLLAACKGEFIALQDADDFSYPDRIKKQIDAIHTQNADLVGTQAGMWFNNDIVSKTSNPLNNEDIIQIMVNSPRVPIIWGSILFKREVYESIGGFDVLFNGIGAADYNWLQRASFNFKFCNLEKVLYLYRQHSGSFTKSSSYSSVNKLYSEEIAFDIFTSARTKGYYDSEKASEVFKTSSEYYKNEFLENESKLFGRNYSDLIFGNINLIVYINNIIALKTKNKNKIKFILYGASNSILGVKRLEKIKRFIR